MTIFAHTQIINSKTGQGCNLILQGLLIYIYAFDHNPPHIHIRGGDDKFTMTIKDRVVEGRAKSKSIAIVNEFLDRYEAEVMDLWKKAQRGEEIIKVKR